MSWFSQFIDNPVSFVEHDPLKALALLAAPVAAVGAPFLLPEIGAAAGGLFGGAEAAGGLFGAGEAAAGAGGLAAGAEGVGAGLGAEAGSAFAFAPEEAGAFGGIEASGLGSGAGLGSAAGSPAGIVTDAFNSIGFGGTSELGDATGVLGDIGSGSGAGGANAFASTAAGNSDFLTGGVGANTGGLGSVTTTTGADFATGGVGGAGQGGLGSVTTTTAGAAPDAGGSFLGKLGTGALNTLTKNPLGVAAAGAGLGINLARGQTVDPAMKAMQAQATQLQAQQTQLTSYLNNGTVPPGLQAAFTQTSQAMKTRLISNAAASGQSTDPSQNSSLAAAINQVDVSIMAAIGQMGVQLLNSGLTAAGMSQQLYATIEKFQMDQNRQTGQAIANFAAALNGGLPSGRPTNQGSFA